MSVPLILSLMDIAVLMLPRPGNDSCNDSLVMIYMNQNGI